MLQNFVAWLQKVESSWQWFLFFQQNYGKLRNSGVWCDRFDSFIISNQKSVFTQLAADSVLQDRFERGW